VAAKIATEQTICFIKQQQYSLSDALEALQHVFALGFVCEWQGAAKTAYSASMQVCAISCEIRNQRHKYTNQTEYVFDLVSVLRAHKSLNF